MTNNCLHGPEVIIEHILDWHPFDYFTKSYELPGVGQMQWTFELAEEDGVTTISVRGEPLSGERHAAWLQVRDDALAVLDHTAHGLVEQLSPAKGRS